ncbi:MAG: hypothetical protein LUC45_04945, partial [Paraprevotella sp.]|nr:hypothetical protein [Paraprevotella sp.]
YNPDGSLNSISNRQDEHYGEGTSSNWQGYVIVSFKYNDQWDSSWHKIKSLGQQDTGHTRGGHFGLPVGRHKSKYRGE